MNSQNKLVSIGMPVYNGQRFLRRALDSLLAQDYKNFELIISDNASIDETRKICEEYLKKDKRITYIRQKENIGILKNFLFVLKRAKGEYFMWAAYDDWWDPAFIFTLKTGLDGNPEKYDAAMSSLIKVNKDNTIDKEIRLSGELDLMRLDYSEVFQKLLARKPIHLFFCGLFRAEFLKKLMARSFPDCIAHDRVLMAEAALATHFFSVPQILHRRTIAKESSAAHQKSMVERHGSGELGKIWLNNKRYSRYVWTMLKWLFTSPVIPLKRKLLKVPFPWLILVWNNRYQIAKEQLPGFRAVVKGLKNRLNCDNLIK